MFKILIPDFVAIELHICSIDEREKSVEINAIIELTSFFGTKTIKMNSLWFEYSVLENFSFRLSNKELSCRETLSDMSDNFVLSLFGDAEYEKFSLIGKETFTIGKFSFEYTQDIGTSEYELIQSAFQNFEKWW